jgi:hypothetical protein
VIFVTIAGVCITRHFDELLELQKEQNELLANNPLAFRTASTILKISIHGLSLLTMSYLILSLTHSVGSGIFAGLMLYTIIHGQTNQENQHSVIKWRSSQKLTLLATVIQPMISFHPATIWSQESEDKIIFLGLSVFVWFLPLIGHLVANFFIGSHGQAFTRLKSSIIFVLFMASFVVLTIFLLEYQLEKKAENIRQFSMICYMAMFVWMVTFTYLGLTKSPSTGSNNQTQTSRNIELQNVPENLSSSTQNLHRPRGVQDRVQLYENIVTTSISPPRLSRSTSPTRTTSSTVQANIQVYEQINPCPPSLTLSESSYYENVESIQGLEETPPDSTTFQACKKYLLESFEYQKPNIYGWRIKYRRLLLLVGTFFFTILTVDITVKTQTFSSKQEIQDLLDLADIKIAWPEGSSPLDDVFNLYNYIKTYQSYIMMVAMLLFWVAVALDVMSHTAPLDAWKATFFKLSRGSSLLGSLLTFLAIVMTSLPDYLEVSNLDQIVPFCGDKFNSTMRLAAEFIIGVIFACLFTFQLMPALITLAPALVRSAALILRHPQLKEDDFRVKLLLKAISLSSLISFPVTFLPLTMVHLLCCGGR